MMSDMRIIVTVGLIPLIFSERENIQKLARKNIPTTAARSNTDISGSLNASSLPAIKNEKTEAEM